MPGGGSCVYTTATLGGLAPEPKAASSKPLKPACAQWPWCDVERRIQQHACGRAREPLARLQSCSAAWWEATDDTRVGSVPLSHCGLRALGCRRKLACANEGNTHQVRKARCRWHGVSHVCMIRSIQPEDRHVTGISARHSCCRSSKRSPTARDITGASAKGNCANMPWRVREIQG